jgi:putative ABC transport system ATP-binding protein
MLRVEKVSKERFLPSGERVRVLDGIDLEAASARITAVIGPSGGGKSTLLRLINRLEEADAAASKWRGPISALATPWNCAAGS